MTIQLNGEPREIDAEVTVAQLVGSLGMKSKYVAVEVNLDLVPRDRHEQHRLKPGDQVEIVTLVGGG